MSPMTASKMSRLTVLTAAPAHMTRTAARTVGADRGALGRRRIHRPPRVAAVARSEIQVPRFGAVSVLVLALIGGCVLPREMMPEETQKISLITPHGWALNAYRELLNADPNYQPNLAIV